MDISPLLVGVGFAGQSLFFSRFLVQWLYSEKQKASVIPTAFWFLSLAGSTLLLTYALARHDPVFILGQLFGFFVYTRNLWFVYHPRGRESDWTAGTATRGAVGRG